MARILQSVRSTHLGAQGADRDVLVVVGMDAVGNPALDVGIGAVEVDLDVHLLVLQHPHGAVAEEGKASGRISGQFIKNVTILGKAMAEFSACVWTGAWR